MGRIQTNIGLITGIPIKDTVDQLMKLAAIPRDNLVKRTDTLKEEQVAVTELSALLLAVQYVTNNLGKADLFAKRKATSSQPSLISAAVSGNPVEGTYRFTPLRTAQQHQLLTSGVKSDTESLGGGTMSFRLGPHVARTMELDLLNGSEGIDRGAIRITDRSGASAEIRLSTVRNIDEVLEAINSNSQINVSAVARDGKIRLIDQTGLGNSNLKVQEVGGGTTAQSLGLAGIDVADSAADGGDLLMLSADFELDHLNDGNGVARNSALPDISYELRDGTSGSIDLSPIIPGGSEVARERSIGDLLEVINAAAPGKLEAEIAADGKRLVIRDLTAGAGTLKIASMPGSSAADDLGIAGESAAGEISGRRLIGGLKSVLVSSLGGSAGLGELGSLELTDRAGATASVSLGGAETLDELIERINGAGVGIVASVNAARNGILLTDTSGGSAGNMIVASGDATGTAEKLKIAADHAASSVNSGDLHQKIISHNTRLADLNGGRGVKLGTFRITDSRGVGSAIQVTAKTQTVGDLIREINRASSNVYAELNATGDGIWIRDAAGGGGTLSVSDTTSTTAADLRLLGGSTTKEVDGQNVQVVDGSMTYRIELEAGESLKDLAGRINALGGGVQAMVLVDGSRNPYRLSLTSSTTGSAGAMVVDMSGLGFSVQETVAASDALMVLGDLESAASSVLLSSRTNTFGSVVEGVRLTIHEASTSLVTVSVTASDVDLVANVQTMVDNYNRFRTALGKHTAYDPATDKKSILTGDIAALRLDTELSQFFSGRFFGTGTIRSLGELGVSINGDGSLAFDASALKTRFTDDPDAVKSFFAAADTGLSARFKTLSEQLSGQDSSLLSNRFLTLGRKVEDNEQRVTRMNSLLERQKERMLMDFYRMELAIGKMQSNSTFLDSIKPIQLPQRN